MGVLIALFLSAAFGAGDQYLGSRVGISWGADAASLSAPWLAVAFLAGCTQRKPWSAALAGLGATAAALVGYFLLTDSPLEGATYSVANTSAFFISNALVVVGGLCTGPLFGWFGQQWRTRRAVAAPLLLAAALCLEPLARKAPFGVLHYAGHGYVVTTPIGSPGVVLGEIAVGLAAASAAIVYRKAWNRGLTG